MALTSLKLIMIVAFLGGTVILLVSVNITLELLLLQRQQRQRLLKPSQQQQQQKRNAGDKGQTATATALVSTIQTGRETTQWRLHSKSRAPQQQFQTVASSAQSYWNQVFPHLTWDAVLYPNHDTGSSSNSRRHAPQQQQQQPQHNLSHVLYSWKQAANLGHAEAQFHYANFLASGISPLSPDHHAPVISDSVIPTSSTPSATLARAYLLWHMAAMDGHVESALALGYRMRIQTSLSSSSPTTITSSPTTSPSTRIPPQRQQSQSCSQALPYVMEAVHGIIDELESSIHSRGKVTPPMDLFYLHDLDAYSNSLSHRQESPDALQYFHLRATQAGSTDWDASSTLAHLYHYGLSGVPQNLTRALEYYELAAQQGSVEGAGQAGKFHVWGLGMAWDQRHLLKAQQYFLQGAPWGLDGCRARFRQLKTDLTIPQYRAAVQQLDICDHPSVNGLGLIHLLGIPMVAPVDKEKARQYFALARDMGNMDASYNLAMMRLGWKTHYRELKDFVEDVDDNDGSQGADNNNDDDEQDKKLPHFLRRDKTVHKQSSSSVSLSGPNKADYLIALQDLVFAANKGHVQARHRLAMMYQHGVNVTLVDNNQIVAIAKDCTKALAHATWIVENASPFLSQRIRVAFQQYQKGDFETSLRNYLAAAETGNELAQVNAAFLLDQGVCLGLTPTHCATASLRLWKAAMDKNPEAAIRAGDLYFYGRLRQTTTSVVTVGPFGWLQYILYPEVHILPILQSWIQQGIDWVQELVRNSNDKVYNNTATEAHVEESTCVAVEGAPNDSTCPAIQPRTTATLEQEDTTESDMAMAARYYRMAAEGPKGLPRANFNLGFLYEWGLGLKQDFPLAKRHYDLAAAYKSPSKSGEAILAVQISLLAMNLHERVVKLYVTWKEWWNRRHPQKSNQEHSPASEAIPKMVEPSAVGSPMPPASTPERSKTKLDVIVSHVVSWESLLIVLLTIVLSKLLQRRRTQR